MTKTIALSLVVAAAISLSACKKEEAANTAVNNAIENTANASENTMNAASSNMTNAANAATNAATNAAK